MFNNWEAADFFTDGALQSNAEIDAAAQKCFDQNVCACYHTAGDHRFYRAELCPMAKRRVAGGGMDVDTAGASGYHQ
jgi:hypothetical protein